MRMQYDDWKEAFPVDFTSNPEKYQQLIIAKKRWRNIEVIISIKEWVRKIMSDNLFFEN